MVNKHKMNRSLLFALNLELADYGIDMSWSKEVPVKEVGDAQIKYHLASPLNFNVMCAKLHLVLIKVQLVFQFIILHVTLVRS